MTTTDASAVVEQISDSPFTLWRIRNDRTEMHVAPQLGGKITNLRDLHHDHEWLWANPHLPFAPTAGETDYVGRFDTGGWDEILPTVYPCVASGTPWGENPLPDHGELWRREWTATPHAEGVRLSLEDNTLPFRMSRNVRLTPEGLEIAYALENRTEEELPFIWAAHPLLVAEPGLRITLPEGAESRCAGAVGVEGVADAFRWPRLPSKSHGEIDLSVAPDSVAGYAVKAFVKAEGAVRIEAPRSAAVIELYCGAPWFGMWLNYGGWSGAGSAPYYNLGVEPTTCPADALDEAIRRRVVRALTSNGQEQWSLSVRLLGN